MGEFKVQIVASEVIARLWSRVSKVTLDYTRRDGHTERLVREVVDHGAAAAILAYNPARNTVLLVSQMRIAAYVAGHHAALLEVCAGLLDGDDPATCATREAEEELGYILHDVQPCGAVFASPGALTEQIHLFIGHYDESSKVSAGGGLMGEGEDIAIVELPLAQAYAMIGRGEIVDAKTVILLQMAMLKSKSA